MKIVYFTHSLRSCWNHGNAHFLRGVLRELIARGHNAVAYEPRDAWSCANLVADHGLAALTAWRETYPELKTRVYGPDYEVERACDGADLVIVHEWSDPKLVAALGQARKRGAKFVLLFHDTHHRAVSEADAMHAFDMSGYDGVLAFGATLAEIYRSWGWGRRAFTWHEAADTRVFHPPEREGRRAGLVWIGNWGDGERTRELGRFLTCPAHEAGLPLDVYGVRYPDKALRALALYGARYRGWLPIASAPAVYARHMATVHVPRRFYTEQLPGIPTIRMFEAMACGIPLVCAPWRDTERLFRIGTDFLVAKTGPEMKRHLTALGSDKAMRAELAWNGLQTIRSRHTCVHRVDELLAIVASLRGPQTASVVKEAAC